MVSYGLMWVFTPWAGRACSGAVIGYGVGGSPAGFCQFQMADPVVGSKKWSWSVSTWRVAREPACRAERGEMRATPVVLDPPP